MKFWISVALIFLSIGSATGQSELEKKNAELRELKSKEQELVSEIEQLKLQGTIQSMKAVGYPTYSKNLEIIK